MLEVVDKIFNGEEIKMKDDLLNEEFDKFLSIHKPSDDVLSLKYFFRAYLTDKKLDIMGLGLGHRAISHIGQKNNLNYIDINNILEIEIDRGSELTKLFSSYVMCRL